jgi:hypothetical protein
VICTAGDPVQIFEGTDTVGETGLETMRARVLVTGQFTTDGVTATVYMMVVNEPAATVGAMKVLWSEGMLAARNILGDQL